MIIRVHNATHKKLHFERNGSGVIIPDLVLPSRVNRRWKYSGIDSLDWCTDKDHFQNYPYPIEYVYNSRGFRDQEWPTSLKELQEAVWCIGDSFTVGLGQPLEHIWPNVLAQRINKRTINVSMDGASNDWIFRRAQDIANVIHPKTIVVMWSYVHRRENCNNLLDDEQRRINSINSTNNQDMQKWMMMVDRLRNIANEVIQMCIPEFAPSPLIIWNRVKDPSWPPCPQNLQELQNLPQRIKIELQELRGCYDFLMSMYDWDNSNILDTRDLPADVIYINERLDWARDHHHFDILTSRWAVDQIENQLRI